MIRRSNMVSMSLPVLAMMLSAVGLAVSAERPDIALANRWHSNRYAVSNLHWLCSSAGMAAATSPTNAAAGASSTNLLAWFDGWAATHIAASPTVNTQTVIVDQVWSRFYRVAVEP